MFNIEQQPKIAIVAIADLKPSEEAEEKHIRKIQKSLQETGILQRPISIDKESKMIIDGHHRYNALKNLGYNYIAVRECNYNSADFSFADNSPVQSKELVLKSSLSGKLLPPKSALHLEKGRIINTIEEVINLSLEYLLYYPSHQIVNQDPPSPQKDAGKMY